MSVCACQSRRRRYRVVRRASLGRTLSGNAEALSSRKGSFSFLRLSFTEILMVMGVSMLTAVLWDAAMLLCACVVVLTRRDEVVIRSATMTQLEADEWSTAR